MLTKQKKLSRKEIKEDKLVEYYYKSQSFFEENKNKVLMYAGILAAVIVAIYFYTDYRASQNTKADALLGNIMEVYDSGSYLEAIEGRKETKVLGLKQIVADYGSTENGETAKIYLANSYLSLGKTDEALKYYEDYSGSLDIFKSAALAGQASIISSKNEYGKAADLYMKASKISKTNSMNADYILQAAINYFDAGDKEQAKTLLQTIRDDYKTSTAFAQVDKYLSQLN